jgi:hypothetical protein
MHASLKAIYHQALAVSEPIEGSHTIPSTATFVFFSSLINPNIALEMGVWNGKSAAVLARLFRRLDLVDIAVPSALQTLQTLGPCQVNFYPDWSSTWLTQNRENASSYDFIHLDTSHSFADTLNELQGAETLAKPDALIVLDDWNEIYPTVAAAYFHYRYVLQGGFEIFLASYNKAYLCRSEYFLRYASQINNLRSFLKAVDIPTHIARTSDCEAYRAFLVRPVTPHLEEYYGGEDNSFYDILRPLG